MRASLTAWMAGLIFGAGLVVSGMTDPRNIVRFLDFSGLWSPNLAFVMISAIAVHGVALRLGTRGGAASIPGASLMPGPRIDGALVGGAAVFGVGWGLGGYCPGPAIVAMGSGRAAPLAFVAASVVGILLADAVRARSPSSAPALEDETAPSAAAPGHG